MLGIALGVLELKRSTVSVAEGIRQNLDNQKKVFIEHFFSTIQFVMAGNDAEGLRYGAIQTPEKSRIISNTNRMPAISSVYSSPVAAAGRIYITSREGVTQVMSHGEAEPRTLAVNRLDDSFSATAALAGREMLLRGEKSLYCIGEE